MHTRGDNVINKRCANTHNIADRKKKKSTTRGAKTIERHAKKRDRDIRREEAKKKRENRAKENRALNDGLDKTARRE